MRAHCEPCLSKCSVAEHEVPIKLCPMGKVFGECADSADYSEGLGQAAMLPGNKRSCPSCGREDAFHVIYGHMATRGTLIRGRAPLFPQYLPPFDIATLASLRLEPGPINCLVATS